MDFDRILPELWVGSHPRTREDVARLREAGVTAVLCLQTDEDLRALGVDGEALAAQYSACGVAWRRAPVRDFDSEDLRDRLAECVETLDALLRAGYTVYLHCSAGAGRSPAVAIAWLAWMRGLSLDEAIATVRGCRPCSPDEEAIRRADADRIRRADNPRQKSAP